MDYDEYKRFLTREHIKGEEETPISGADMVAIILIVIILTFLIKTL